MKCVSEIGNFSSKGSWKMEMDLMWLGNGVGKSILFFLIIIRHKKEIFFKTNARKNLKVDVSGVIKLS